MSSSNENFRRSRAFSYLAGGLTALVLTDRRARAMSAVEGRPDPPTPWRSLGLAVMVLGIVVFSGTEPRPFVYFQF